MISELFRGAGNFCYRVTLGTFQEVYKEREFLTAYSLAKMVLKSSATSLSVGLLASSIIPKAIHLPIKTICVTVFFATLAHLHREHTDTNAWMEDQQKQNEWLDWMNNSLLDKYITRY